MKHINTFHRDEGDKRDKSKALFFV